MFKWLKKLVPISALTVIFFSLCSIYCGTANAAMFTIEPAAGTVLPTVLNTIPTKAFYTITNSTGSTRSGIFVKYLPPNVSQVTNSPLPNVCTQNFSLAAHQSCTLELNITGTVSSSDPFCLCTRLLFLLRRNVFPA